MLRLISAFLAGLSGVITRNTGLGIGVLTFFGLITFIVKIVRTVNDSNQSDAYKNLPVPDSERKRTGKSVSSGRSASVQTQRRNPNVPQKNSNAPVITVENFSYAVALPEGVRFTPKEENIIKMILNNPMTPKEILSRVPRSVNIYEYKVAILHLEEIGVMKLGEFGRYAGLFWEDFF